VAVARSRLATVAELDRVDAVLAWRRPPTLERARTLLPDDYPGFFMRLSAQVDDAALADGGLDDWEGRVRALRGGSVRFVSFAAGGDRLLTVGLPGRPIPGVEDDVLDPYRAHLRDNRIRVTYAETVDRRRGDDDAIAAAAARVREAWRRMSTTLRADSSDYEAWLGQQPHREPADPEWLTALPDVPVDAPWSRAPEPATEDLTGAELRSTDVARAAFNVHAVLPAGAEDTRVSLLRALLGLLPSVDEAEVACVGSVDALTELMGSLPLGRRADGHRFGVSTFHADALEPGTLDALLSDPVLSGDLASWGLRWSPIAWHVPAGDAEGSFYFARSDGRGAYDSLTIRLASDDPEAPLSRHARERLAERLESDIARGALWHAEGQPAESPRGRRYAALSAALDAAREEAAESPEPVAPQGPSRAPRLVRWLKSRATTSVAEATTERLRAAVLDALPGFRLDRLAHPTPHYFLDFVRQTPGGWHTVQFVRLHPEPGHRIRVAASLFRVDLDDLEPATGRVHHGLVWPLGMQVPERPHPLEWRYATEKESEAAVADSVRVLVARALPLFDRAEVALRSFRAEHPDLFTE
jgi:hypothetical protein